MRETGGGFPRRHSPAAHLACILCLFGFILIPGLSAESGAVECARIGDTISQVLRFCGDPHHVDRTEELRQGMRYETVFVNDGRRRWITVSVNGPWVLQVEEWTYDFGPTKFVRILTFEDSILVNVRNGGYGSRHGM